MFTTPHNVDPLGSKSSPPLRCGLVVSSLGTGGVEEVVAMLATELPNQGIATSVLCTHAGGPVADRLRAAGISVTVGNGSKRRWRAWASATRPNVIASHCTSVEAVQVLSRVAPVVEVIHNTNVWFSPAEWADALTKANLATALVACSATASAYQVRALGPRAITVIPNGVQNARLADTPRAEARQALGFRPDDIVFVHVGRFCIQKNLLGLIDSVAELSEENPRVRLLLVGRQEEGTHANPADEVYAREVSARAGKLVARGVVQMLPFTPDPGLALSAADAYISNAFFEGWSLAATEAMWLGLPAILSDCGSSSDLIGPEGERGILVPNPAGDPTTLKWRDVVKPATQTITANRHALGHALRSFIAQRELWARRAAAIRQAAREQWSAGRMAASYADVLRKAAHVDFTPATLLRHYWNVSGARPRQLVLPMLLVLLAGACEFASFSLLIPLTRAVGANSFAFLETSRAFGWIAHLVPATLPDGPSRNIALIVITIGLVIVGRFGKLVFEYLRGFYVVARTERYRVAIQTETFRRVLGFGRQYFDGRPIGHSDAVIGWSSSVVELLTATEEVVRYGIGLFVKAGVMLAISVPLSLAFAITLPFVGLMVTAIDRRVTRIAADGMAADRTVRTRILDILGSIPLVKVNSQEREAAATYTAALDEARGVKVRRERITSIRYPIEEMVILLVMLLVQGVVMTLDGGFSPGKLTAFGAFLLIVQQSLPDYKFLSWFRLRVVEEWPQLTVLAELYSDEGKHMVPSGPRQLEGLHRGIELRDLRFGYESGNPVLHGVNATIEAGKITAIVGRSGAGKTTLVDLIARLYDCPRETVFLDGTDIREFNLPSIHARLGMVSQDVWLLNGTLRESLTFGLNRAASDQELLDALADVDLLDFFQTLRDGLATSIGDRGVRLSGGQRQRVALARALLRDPEILILDEATSALDSEVEQRVARAIQRRAAGRTLIMIAHRLSTIRDADAILVMENGKVVERGTWDDLLRLGGAFGRLHDAQAAGGPGGSLRRSATTAVNA